MPHLCKEPHLRWVIGVIIRESQCRFEEATLEISMVKYASYLVESIGWTLKDNVPLEEIIFVFKSHGAPDLIVLRKIFRVRLFTENYPLVAF